VALAISLITGSQPLGGVIGSLIGGYIVSAFGIISLWWFDCLLIALVVFMLVLFYHEPFTPRATPPLFNMLRSALRSVATTPVVVKYFVFSFIATSAFFFSYTYISTRVIELAPGADAARTIGLVFGIAGIATLLATPVWGLLAGKFGGSRLLPLVTLLTALAYVPLFFARDVAQFTLFYFLLSCFSPAINSLTFATIGLETPPEHRNAVMSMIFMPINAAIIAAPALAGAAAVEVRQVFLFSAACGLAAVLLLFLTRRVGVRYA
jgi:DHA1 family multidrug resistance protein-like MFS transporter